MNHVIKDNTGVQYIFAYFIKNAGWKLCQQFFRITHKEDSYILGQYLTSLWYSHIYRAGDIQRYMVIGVRGGFSVLLLSKIINVWDKNSGGEQEGFPAFPSNIVFKDIYKVPIARTVKEINERQEEETFLFPINGKYTRTPLTLRARKIQNGLYMTLPDFVLDDSV